MIQLTDVMKKSMKALIFVIFYKFKHYESLIYNRYQILR